MPLPPLRIVHEGRGGFLDIEGRRYPIEHVADGRFCIHVSRRAPKPDRAAIEALVASEPERWTIE